MLQLRQMIDSVLDEMGFEFLHLERSHNGEPVLTSVCGKPVISLLGITLPARLTTKERDYAYTLIQGYCVEKEDDINWMIKVRANPIDLNTVTDYSITHATIGGHYKWENGRQEYKTDTSVKHFTLTDEKFEIRWPVNDNDYSYRISDFVDIDAIHNSIAKIDIYKSAIQIYYDKWQEKNKLDKRIQEISTCQI